MVLILLHSLVFFCMLPFNDASTDFTFAYQDDEQCDACMWTSPAGAYYDLSPLCGRPIEVSLENPTLAQLQLGICSPVPCEGHGSAFGCLYAPGNPPTPTGSSYTFEQIETNIPAVGVRVILTGGEKCSASKQPRKTIVNVKCKPTVAEPSSDTLRGWEGEGLDICTYYVDLFSPHGCPTHQNNYVRLRPSITAVSGCIDTVPKLSTYDCHAAGGTEITIHGVDFIPEAKQLKKAAVEVQVGDRPCGNARVVSAWRLSCQLPAGAGEGHKITASLKIHKSTRIRQDSTAEVQIEELFVTCHTATVSYKPMIDYKRHFDSFLDLGVGGLTPQIQQLYQRAFASRSIPASVLSQMGIDHAKGILLYGPPGSGKTLLARTIAKILQTDQVTLVNAPEIMSKYLGESEKNLRGYFEAAEKDWLELGEVSDLHVIIIDEIDAICKPRGKSDSSAAAAAYDSVVNQLLTKMDGLKSLHNILVIGMTNRRDMIDPALLRPGRFEIQIEIGLPDTRGRWEIFTIHTREMQENHYLGKDVDIEELAANTSQYSGAEIAGLVRLAASFALDRRYGKDSKVSTLQIRKEDFQKALQQFKPAYTQREEDVLGEFLPRGYLEAGPTRNTLLQNLLTIVENFRRSVHANKETVLLYGENGVGKSGLAAHLAAKAKFTFVKVVKAADLIRLNTNARAEVLIDAFHDAFKAEFGLLILDDLHLLVEAVRIDHVTKASEEMLYTINTLMASQPPEGHQLLVVSTLWSEGKDLQASYTGRLGLQHHFKHKFHISALNIEGITDVIGRMGFKCSDGWPLAVQHDLTMTFNDLMRVTDCVDYWLTMVDMPREETPQNYFDSCVGTVA